MKELRQSKLWLVPFSTLLLVTVAIAITTHALSNRVNNQVEPLAVSATPPTPASEKRSIPRGATSTVEVEIARLIDHAIDTSDFSSARWGVCVLSLRDGRLVYARNADKLFTPASNMKIYTTAVALEALGADYRWRTSVYTAAPPAVNGTINGDLTLYGRGAADLTSRPQKEQPASLAQLANDLYQQGVRRVQGDIVGDESYFRAEPLGEGWQWNDIQWYFGAEPSALSIDDNEVDIEIKPPTGAGDRALARLSNAQDFMHLTNDIATVKRGEHLTVGIHRGLSDNEVRVWGDFPLGGRGFDARLSIHDPARLAATLFIKALTARGITVNGKARTRDFRVSPRFDPSQQIELAAINSKPLAEIVKATNKESINLNAELILRTLGRERGESAPDDDPHKNYERGDDQAGVAVIRKWLAAAGVATENLALHDGSGLSRLDLITPEATVRLLQAMSKAQTATIFRASLPLAGTDGTLRGRLRTYKERVSAKTGSLTYDNSLSGFLTTASGEDLVFSIMCNDQIGRVSSIPLIDEIVGILADHTQNMSSGTQKP